MQIPRAFEEVLDQSSVDFVALPDGGAEVVAEHSVDVPLVVLLPHEQEEGVAVLADGGAEVHQPLKHVPVAGLHLCDLDGLVAGLGRDAALLGVLHVGQVQDLHSDLDPRVLGGFVQHGPNPVCPEEDPLPGRHDRAVESVRHGQGDALSDVGHQEDL